MLSIKNGCSRPMRNPNTDSNPKGRLDMHFVQCFMFPFLHPYQNLQVISGSKKELYHNGHFLSVAHLKITYLFINKTSAKNNNL